MIDYLELKVACKHQQFGGSHGKFEGTRVIRQWRGWDRIRNPRTNGVAMARSIKNGDFLIVKGNPAQYFQGHNLFGTSRIFDLAIHWLCAVLGQLGIKPSGEELASWRAGNVEVRRVDIAENYKFVNSEVVRAVIRETAFYLIENGHPVSTYRHFATIYYQQYSRRWALKMYDKGARYKKFFPPLAKLGVWQMLTEYAQGLMRVELCLRKPELSQKRLNVLSAWKDVHPRRLFKARLKRIIPTSSMSVFEVPEALNCLGPMERLILKFYEDGNDLSRFLSSRTVMRYRKRFSDQGVHLCRKRSSHFPTVKLSDALSGRRCARKIPTWARDAGLFFSPDSCSGAGVSKH